jgi:PAS domain S-box-containing protein
MTGISNEEIQGKTPVEAVGEEIGETIEAQYQECVERREMIEYPEEIPVDGEMRHWQTKLTPIIDDGTVVKLVGAMRDVTEQKAREAELNEAIRELETILDTAECAIFLKDADGVYQMLNTTARELLDIDCDGDITGLTDHDLFPEEVADSYRADDERVLASGEPLEITEEVPTEEGTRTYLTRKSPVFDETGEPSGVCAVGTDITAQEQRDQLAAENERLEQFANVISHDLRNPLTVAQGNVELAQETYEAGDELETTSRALDRMETLINDVLALARQNQAIEETGPISLSAIAEDCWATIESPDATLEVVSEYCFSGDEQRVKQLFENIFRNAIEHGDVADPPVGNSHTDAEGVTLGDADLCIRVGTLADGDGFYIENSGTPIPEAESERIFAEGYSTDDEGLGLGLAIADGVVSAHDWDITVTDGALSGPRFEIFEVEAE